MAINYHIYASTGVGDPIDYTTIVATVAGLSWPTPALAANSHWRYGVRAFNTVSGLEEQNTDAAVAIDLDAGQLDVTNRPLPPEGLSAYATASGGARIAWTAPIAPASRKPTGFRVYRGIGTPNYASAVATVAYGVPGPYRANLTGLSDGVTYAIGVRAYNASGEETNTLTVSVTGDTSAPASVDNLAASVV